MLRYRDCPDNPELMLNEMFDESEAQKISLHRGSVWLFTV
jgi:hypothetical protein